MEVYRLSREMYASPLSGKGAALKGARWNAVGIELIYTAANRSLAMAEVTVHLTVATLPDDYVMMNLFVPDDISLQKINAADLPDGWNVFPHPAFTKTIGDQFVSDNKFCVLQVPSSVTQGDYNLLINPTHPDFKRIQIIHIVKFPFDKRLF